MLYFLMLGVACLYASSEKRVQLPEDLEIKLVTFERAVTTKQKSRVLEVLDSEYKLKEHDGLFQGNTDQFLNEVFCGKTLDETQMYCINFDEISKLTRRKVEKTKKGFDVIYRVKAKEREIESVLSISAKPIIVYGIIGSNGVTQVE